MSDTYYYSDILRRVTDMEKPRMSSKKSARALEREVINIWKREANKNFPEKDGWFYQGKGFPDLVYFNKKTKEIVFVEVKTGSHRFHAFQKQMIYMLINANADKRKSLLVTYDKQKILQSKKDALDSAHDGVWEGVKDAGFF